MSLDILSYVKKINNAYDSSGQKETELFEIRRVIEREFSNPLDYEANALVNGSIQGLLVLKDKEDGRKKIFARPSETFSLGDVVDCYGIKWLITEIDANTQIRYGGKMDRCNYNLSFLDSTGQPTSRPCIVESSAVGVTTTGTTNQMTLGDGQLSIKLSFDTETSLFDKTYPDGKNQRLLLDYGTSNPKAYEIINADRVSFPGLVVLVVKECLRSEDDNVELMIGGYYSRVITTPVVTGVCEISYLGDPVLKLGQGLKSFQAIFRDNLGNVLPSAVAVWNISLTNPALLPFIISETSGNTIKLKVVDKQMIGVPIRLELKDVDETMSSFVLLEVVPLG